ncbi:hypothetical protein LTS08_001296 [Lithohypha guttulata]|uniref:Transmembrane protein 135 N-terminal domain-containing protein n=1 Tax=Lithohypha guttulata TaxID=1690604 RepID=A0AAN7Y8V1_9EURO|nr:hypothetical protein LTR51_007703 [Lithohypha guttulata]KAK5081718.1 hypothetical protein LTR05_007852 [Lithohypha guttulata]KAK5105023.1 hypothetical protein LTS08_001296 [Lithohypha guttulata]
MRKELLQEHVQPFRDRHPYLWKALTWRLAPAAGASLSGLALGIYPQDQLRVTIALYVLIRAGELLYKGAEAKGYLKRKPKWVGSWMLAALSHGQLLHAFLFDPECVPAIYSDFILNNSPEYLQPRPSNLSEKILLSSSSIGRTMTLYYSALSLSRISSLVKQPSAFTTALVTQILRSTASIVATIAGIWGSICFGNNYLPRSFMSTFRFLVAGSIAGSAAAIDWSPTGHANNMYVLRNSLDSLWKVGVKRRWWRDVKGGDVYLVVLSLAVMNILYDSQKQTFDHDGSMRAIKVLRGEIEVGLKNKTEHET